MKGFGAGGRECQLLILALKKISASWEQQNGAVSPMISSSRCYRILHSSAVFQEHSAKFPHSPLFVPLSCRCTALGLAPRSRV